MRILSINKEACILEADKKDDTSRSFIFSIKMIPITPTPKNLIIIKKWGRRLKTYGMSWSKFLKQTCLDDIAMIDKTEFIIKWKEK
jgi:hypothetical protein